MRRRSYITFQSGFILVAVICIATLAYYPGLHGPFVFDDTINITNNPGIALTKLGLPELLAAARANDTGIFHRPLASLSFAINHYFAGGFANPQLFKLTNIAIHLINTFLVFWFVILLLRQHKTRLKHVPVLPETWIAALVAAAWALHPLHLTSVLYVVQRMTSLSALFVLTGLIVFIHGRNRVQQARPRGFMLMFSGWIVGLTLGIAGKENAVLILLFMPLIEYAFYQEKTPDIGAMKNLLRFYVLTAWLPLTLIAMWLILQPELILNSYQTREFTLPQRLLTEARALWYYISLLLYPDIREFSLYHDDFKISLNLMTPWTTLPACIGVILAGIIGFAARSKYPVLSFSILWYLAGHSMESSFIGLELVHEHRNYLPDVGPLMGLVYGITQAFYTPALRLAPLILVIPLLSAFAIITNLRARTWADEEDIIRTMVRNHPDSARAQTMMGELLAYRKHERSAALAHYQLASNLAPEDTGVLIRMVTVAADIRIDTNPVWGAHSQDSDSAMKEMLLPSAAVDRISEKLAEARLSPSTMSALVSLSECFAHQPNACQVLYPVASRWYLAAIRNPHNSTRERHSLVSQFFEVAYSQGDYERALSTIQQARKDDPHHPQYNLMEANLYIKLNKLSVAGQILTTVAATPDRLSRDDMANLETLRSMIERKQNRQPQ